MAVLGASSLTYAEATWTQALPDWIGAHIRLFRFLGGIGRWRDSGMAGTPAAEHARAFASSPYLEWVDGSPLQALTRILRETRPQVVITYDEVGGYGHPDHIAAHLLTHAAVVAAVSMQLPHPQQVEHPGRRRGATQVIQVADGAVGHDGPGGEERGMMNGKGDQGLSRPVFRHVGAGVRRIVGLQLSPWTRSTSSSWSRSRRWRSMRSTTARWFARSCWRSKASW